MKDLYTEERRTLILKNIEANSRVSVSELAKHFNVSEATIRTDLRYLEDKNLLQRTRGGAIAADENDLSFASRLTQHIDEKQAIALASLQYIHEHDSILFDASSTCLELAKMLRKTDMTLTVITNGIHAAQALVDNPNITTMLIGGVLRNQNNVEGLMGAEILDKVYVKKFFFSARAASPEGDLMDFDLHEVDLKRRMFDKSMERYCLLDSSKLGKYSVGIFGSLAKTHTVITDGGAEKMYAKSFPNLQITTAKPLRSDK
ncbi:DeoR/GlpR family DNA-binding transcription regulator [Alicyclobacillus fastidiosus]|uniref:DeoR/GlpR family DNA-binding transcription regulator n=1 Tax=Alicyclobacillus fastidiosus TaxID=392011 RepID=A0ABY6ZFE6_9BACL|nr:DeoR/GlpR family DNA-binding transcription regulator [Alicyclobacillus fastidiosus]WAH41227.1 DeoR/GlpR family DNA-binding transcription regulator [Alicyclobacillus fastidiosus]GMA62816.1 DeoR family transcriptional regulator [Alicyclobacillus fastidiosus]